MKAQMKFQKILTLITLIMGAIVFVYALCFTTGNIANLLFYKNASISSSGVEAIDNFFGADDFVYAQQTFVGVTLILGIVYICGTVLLYITSTNTRRNYYVTNYVAIGIMLAIIALVALYVLIDVSVLVVEFNNIDWEGIEYIRGLTNRVGNLYLTGSPDVYNNTYGVFIIGYVVGILALLNAAAWVLNLLLKIKLMKGEKALLANGAHAEVA